MISKYFYSRCTLLRSASLPFRVNGILNFKFKNGEESKSFHSSPPSFNETKNKNSYTTEVRVWSGMTVREVARAFNITTGDLAFLLPDLKLKENDVVNSPSVLSPAVKKLGYKLVFVENPNKIKSVKKNFDFKKQPPSKPENLVKRPPVVTVMGHVDHGKTTLLDSLRNSFIVQQEFGGITQHIGAFSVEVKPGERITFIDTPGHAAFTALRARGAETTDLVVLVVAADDGVMDQTIESIKIAKLAQVPMVVAVNKIDKPTTLKIEDIKNRLLVEGIQVEDQGGDVQLVPISALKKINLDLLTEVILLQADLMNLQGDPTGLVEGVIIESKLEKTGIVSTVIIKRGTLKKGKILVAGTAFARVRRMLDENGNDYKEAPPSTPVQIFGWKEMPLSGDEVYEVPTEKQAKMILNETKKQYENEKILSERHIIEKKAAEHQEKHHALQIQKKSFDNWKDRRKFIQEQRQEFLKSEKSVDLSPHLKIILKGDAFGTLEVLSDILSSYDKEEECKLSIVEESVGDISQNDIELAECFNAIIYAFNVNFHPGTLEMMKDKNIEVRHHNVLYKLIDDVKDDLTARIPPKDGEEIIGEAEVLQNFLINQGKKKVPVAGARCIKGELKKESLYRILRDEEVIYEGQLAAMKNEKKAVKLIPKGMECGLMFESSPEKFKPGDKIICYEMVKVPRRTSWNPGF